MKESGREVKIGALGGGVGFLVVLLTAAGFAWLINRELLGLEHMDLTGAGALVLGGLAAGFSCGRGEGRWLRAGIAAMELLLVLLAVNLIGFDGALPGLLPCVVLVLGSVAAAALVMGEKGGRRKYQIKKYRTG